MLYTTKIINKNGAKKSLPAVARERCGKENILCRFYGRYFTSY
jgi:hypothetical protein